MEWPPHRVHPLAERQRRTAPTRRGVRTAYAAPRARARQETWPGSVEHSFARLTQSTRVRSRGCKYGARR